MALPEESKRQILGKYGARICAFAGKSPGIVMLKQQRGGCRTRTKTKTKQGHAFTIQHWGRCINQSQLFCSKFQIPTPKVFFKK